MRTVCGPTLHTPFPAKEGTSIAQSEYSSLKCKRSPLPSPHSWVFYTPPWHRPFPTKYDINNTIGILSIIHCWTTSSARTELHSHCFAHETTVSHAFNVPYFTAYYWTKWCSYMVRCQIPSIRLSMTLPVLFSIRFFAVRTKLNLTSIITSLVRYYPTSLTATSTVILYRTWYLWGTVFGFWILKLKRTKNNNLMTDDAWCWYQIPNMNHTLYLHTNKRNNNQSPSVHTIRSWEDSHYHISRIKWLINVHPT